MSVFDDVSKKIREDNSNFFSSKNRTQTSDDSFLKKTGIIAEDVLTQTAGGVVDAVEAAYNFVVPEDKQIEISDLVPEGETTVGRFIRPASQFFIPYTGAYKVAKGGYLFVKNGKNLNKFIDDIGKKKVLRVEPKKDTVDVIVKGARKKKTQAELLSDAAKGATGRKDTIKKPFEEVVKTFRKDTGLTKKEAVFAGLGAGALVDAVAFAPYDPNLADLFMQYPGTKNAVAEWLQTDPNGDPGMERLKNTIANAVPSAVIPLFLNGVSKGFVWSRDSMAKSVIKKSEDKVLKEVKKDKKKTVKQQTDEALGVEDRGVSKGDDSFIAEVTSGKQGLVRNTFARVKDFFYDNIGLKRSIIQILDSNAGLKYLEEAATKAGVKSLPRLKDTYKKTLGVYNESRFLPAIGGMVEAFLFKGTFRFKDGTSVLTGNDGLEGILKNTLTTKYDPDKFFDYMGAKSLLDLESKNKAKYNKLFINAEKAQAAKVKMTKDVKRGDAIPEYRAALEKMNQFNSELLDFAVDAQILSPALKQQLLDARMPYVPLYRDLSVDEIFQVSARGGSKLRKRLRGAPIGFGKGELPLKNLFDNYLENINSIITTSYKNYILRNTFDLIELGNKGIKAGEEGGLTAWARKVKLKKGSRIKIKKEEIQQALVKQKGKDLDEIDINDLEDFDNLTLFRSENTVLDEKEFLVYRLQGDEIVPSKYKINNPLLYDTLKSISPKQYIETNALFRAGRFVKNILTKGVTLDPGFFAGANALRDTFSAAILSRNKFYVPILSTVRALVSRMKSNSPVISKETGQALRNADGSVTTSKQLYEEFFLNGGSFGSTLWRGEVSETFLREFYRKLGHSNYKNVLNRPAKYLDNYGKVVTSFENASRFTEYQLLRQAGYSAREAALAAREVAVDFGMHGANTFFRQYTSTVPFLNAGLQGIYRTIRAFKTREEAVAVVSKFTAYTLTPSLMLYAINRNDPAYFNVNQQIRDLHFMIPIGDGDYLKIPRPFEFGSFASIITNVFETLDDKGSGGDMDRFFKTSFKILQQQFRLGLTPQLVSPWWNARANKTYFGSPIIPSNMANSLPDYGQSYPWTSKLITSMVENLPLKLRKSNLIMSPIEYEYYYRAFTGAVGGFALDFFDEIFDLFDEGEAPDKRLDEMIFLKRFLQLDPLKFTQAEADFYELKKQADSAVNQVEKFKDEQKIKLFNELINDPETMELMGINPELQRIAALASKINAQRNLIVSDKKMDGETKRFKIDQLEKQMLIYFEETMKVIKKLDLIVKQPLIKVPTIFK